MYRNVDDICKGEPEALCTFTSAIHANKTFYDCAMESMASIIEFVEEYKASQKETYD